MIKKFSAILTLMMVVMSLTGCGQGGKVLNTGAESRSEVLFEGNGQPSTADADNAEALAIAAVEATKEGVQQNLLPQGLVSNQNALNDLLIELTNVSLTQPQYRESQVTAALVTLAGGCGGTLGKDIANDQGSGTYTYTRYCTGNRENPNILDGVFTFETVEESIDYEYTNFLLTINKQTFTFNVKASCKGLLGAARECEYEADFRGQNDKVYRVGEVSVTVNNDNSRFNVKATVAEPEFGTITVNAVGIGFCLDGNIGGGGIKITDSTASVVIDVAFLDCNVIEVTFGGNLTTVAQS